MTGLLDLQEFQGGGTYTNYGCTIWRTSSQRAVELYNTGTKLWRREDFVNIEEQLADSCTTQHFKVRRLDGSLLYITNPMFGVLHPTWKPYVKFQEYWQLVQSKPAGPPETYHCTYLVDWVNHAVRNYDQPFENARILFNDKKQQWDTSTACTVLTSQIRELLKQGGSASRVSKIVCFGLGDINTPPPDWWRIQNNELPEEKREEETSVITGALVHHAIALTLANIARSYTGKEVRLLTQDPNYCDASKILLKDMGFEVVGNYGAGGFADIDDESIVFSAFAKAPVKQIIADFARPIAVLGAKNTTGGVWNSQGKPYADPESPRTRQMWKGYQISDFPESPDNGKIGGNLHQIILYSRIGDCNIADE